MRIPPSKTLLRFQREVCPNVPLSSPEITFLLIKKIAKLKKEIGEREHEK